MVKGKTNIAKDHQVVLRMPGFLIKAVEGFAKHQGSSQSDAIGQLVQRGLHAWIEDQR